MVWEHWPLFNGGSSIRVVGLAPIGVLPEYQGQGIGSRLIRVGLEACREAAYDAVVVLGEPGYYFRFGFERASGHGLGNEYGVDDYFMVAELRSEVLDGAGAPYDIDRRLARWSRSQHHARVGVYELPLSRLLGKWASGISFYSDTQPRPGEITKI